MECAVVWTPLAIETFENNLTFIQEKWNQQILENFFYKTKYIINFIAQHPNAFPNVNERKNVRSVLIVIQIRLYYKYYPKKKTIALLTFFDTRQNPK